MDVDERITALANTDRRTFIDHLAGYSDNWIELEDLVANVLEDDSTHLDPRDETVTADSLELSYREVQFPKLEQANAISTKSENGTYYVCKGPEFDQLYQTLRVARGELTP